MARTTPVYTAQCDAATGYCGAVSETGPLVTPEGKLFIPLEFYDDSRVGKYYYNDAWHDEPQNG